MAVALVGAHPTLVRDDDGDGFVRHLDFGGDFLFFLDERAALVGKGLGVGFDLFDHQALQAFGVGQNVLQLAFFFAQLFELFLDLDGFQPGQLAQADFQNVFGLAVGQLKALNQRSLGFVAATDDGNHLVDVEQNDLTAFQNVDAGLHLLQTVLRAASDGALAEIDPLFQHAAQRLLHGLAVQTNHGQVDAGAGLQAGVGQQSGDQVLLRSLACLGLNHQTHSGVFAGFVAHAVQHREDGGFELLLVLRKRFLAGLDLGVGELFDLFQNFLRRHAGRQLVDHHLPLAARQLFNAPAGAHLQAATARGVGVANVLRAADDLAAAGVIGASDKGVQLVIAQRGLFDQRHAGIGHFTQVVAGDFSGQTHGNAAGTIEQRKRQSCRQLLRLLRAAVVIGHKVDCAFVNFIQQQRGDFGKPRFGVTHGGCAVTVAATKVALPIHQRVALREVLRHAHQRVVGRLVTMGVKAAQHITHHTGRFDGLGSGVVVGAAKAQAHAVHGVQNAALHGFHAVGHIWQGTALDHAERVLQIGTLGVPPQLQGVSRGLGG